MKSRGWVLKRRRKKGKKAERFKTPRLVGYERVKKSRGQYLSGEKSMLKDSNQPEVCVIESAPKTPKHFKKQKHRTRKQTDEKMCTKVCL